MTEIDPALQEGGVYLVKNLVVSSGGQLSLASGDKPTQIYVTGRLTVDSPNAILNTSRKSGALRLFYTGTRPVVFSGGSQSFAVLYAPRASVDLRGFGGAFFGAISSRELSVNRAQFHYDTATRGIATGLDSTSFILLGRYHL